MDGVAQSRYERKNWSSLVLWNAGHYELDPLTTEAISNNTGGWLHGFKWMQDRMIGNLPVEWNWLDGWSDKKINPSAVLFTRGTPDMIGYENTLNPNEWREIWSAQKED